MGLKWSKRGYKEGLYGMNEYSRLKSIELINFMGFVKAKAVIDDSGSLNFKGYNSSGKSAFLTSLAVALMNAFPSKQSKYIHHGKDYFRIIIGFDDGVVIVRDKYKTGQSLYEMYQGEKKIYSSKVGSQYSRVDDVPQVIQNYLALIKTDIGYLNYQVRRDPLWLVETKGSDNYYTLNEVLKSVEIAQANAMLNTDKNALNTEITIVESEFNTLRGQLINMGSCGEALLGRLYDKQNAVNEIWKRYDALEEIERLSKELDEVKISPEVGKIDADRFIGASSIRKTVAEIENLRYFDRELSDISVDRFKSVSGIGTLLGEIRGIQYFDEKVESIGGLAKQKDLESLEGIISELSKVLMESRNLKDFFESLESERDALIADAKKQGIMFTVCKNCGTMLEVKQENG